MADRFLRKTEPIQLSEPSPNEKSLAEALERLDAISANLECVVEGQSECLRQTFQEDRHLHLEIVSVWVILVLVAIVALSSLALVISTQ